MLCSCPNPHCNQARTAGPAWSTTGWRPTTRSRSTPTSPRSTSTTSRTRTFRMPTPSPFRAMWVYPCHTTMNHEPMSCEKKTIFQNLFPFIPQSCQNVRDRIKCACFNWGHLSARMAHWPAQAWPNISACIPQLPSVGGRGPSSQRWPSRVSLFLEVAKRQMSANVLCIRLHFRFLAPKLFLDALASLKSILFTEWLSDWVLFSDYKCFTNTYISNLLQIF